MRAKKFLITAFVSVVAIIAAAVSSSGSVLEDQVAVKLRFGRVVDTIYGPTQYVFVPFIEHVFIMQKHRSDKVSVANKEISVTIEVTNPESFYLAYSGSHRSLLDKVEARVSADKSVLTLLSANSDLSLQIAGANIKLWAKN